MASCNARLCRVFLIAFSALFTFGFGLTASAADVAADRAYHEALKKAVSEVLKENPDILLNILKENSEMVLEIAQQGNTLRKRKAMLAQWEQDAKSPKTIDLQGRPFRGKKTAPLTIVAYSDFTCPYCRQAEYVMQQILKKYDGKVRMSFKPLPKDEPFSLAAAKYSIAAFRLDEAKGWEFFDALFKNIEQYEREGDDFLKNTAVALGYDFKKLKSEAGSAQVQEMLDTDRKEADRYGISGTPHFLVGNLLVRGVVSKDLFEEAVDMALRQAGVK
ncbi:MAG: thioredoxin domain-containing protein [Desulfovibrio sp.]|nr:thioredoxin domain-containing protein [Desulfovibrio sp.]